MIDAFLKYTENTNINDAKFIVIIKLWFVILLNNIYYLDLFIGSIHKYSII
jgi:hypothetical protein